MAEGELVELQVEPEAPRTTAARTKTDLLLPPTRSVDRLRHFPEEVYDLSAESHLVRFLKVLLGDAGVGQLRKRLLLQRMQSTLQGTHFYDLDRFYGPLFGVRRTTEEVLSLDPYSQTGTTAQWDEALAKDASFRSRIEQFSKALAYGATPTGMELIAEALLAVDCDVYESYIQADSSYQTYAELESQYGVNLLTANQEDLETDTTGWVAGANTTIARSTTWWASGTASLQLTATAAGDISASTPGGAAGVAVTAGETYSFVGTVQANAAARSVRLEIDWYDGAATPAVLSTSAGTAVTESPTKAVGPEVVATAPAGSVTAAVRIVVVGAAAAEVHRSDLHSLSRLNYADMEGVSYGTLEGSSLSRMSGNERRVFTIRPKRRISLSEARDLRRVLNRIKPADSRFVIDNSGVPLHAALPIGGVVADSDHWEILSEVVSTTDTAVNPYQVVSGVPVEQPRPPFSSYQGEAWSYSADISGRSTYSMLGDEVQDRLPTQRVVYSDRSFRDFSADQAILPQRMVLSGRVVSDGILVAHPYPSPRGLPTLHQNRYTLSPSGIEIGRLYSDGIPLDALNDLLKDQSNLAPYQQNPEYRYWVTPERYMLDDHEDVLQINLNGPRVINYVTFEVSKFPHRAVVEVLPQGGDDWIKVLERSIFDSTPRVLSDAQPPRHGQHPSHSHAGHWEKISARTQPVVGIALRVRLRHIPGNPPQRYRVNEPTPYSLAMRSLDLGYRVTSRDDFAALDLSEDGVIANTRNVAGSMVQFKVHEHLAENLLAEDGYWRSEPQPVNYAVVNLYLDTRGDGDGTVIDRFFLDPTHVGAHFSIYYSNDPQETDGTEGFYEERAWTPIPRDYTLQKGYVHVPATRARYWKFEFTNLVAESYETLLPINRKVRLFPRSLVEMMHRNYGQTSSEVPRDMLPAIDAARESRYSDALNALNVGDPEAAMPDAYRSTDALYFPDLTHQQRLRDESWVFGFTPWHQGDHAPRFPTQGRHVYEVTEVRHDTKVAFFVGLRKIEAYRTQWEADEDTQVYFDTFDDFRNLTPGFTWTFQPGYMTSGGISGRTSEATSRVFSSLHNVEAVQFATEQVDPIQLVPDHNFRNPGLSSYQWDNPDDFLRVGDAELIYSVSDHTVLNLRYVVPPPRLRATEIGLVQPPHHPVFSTREYDTGNAVVTNLATNPSGEADAGWTAGSPSQTVEWDTTVKRSGTRSRKSTAVVTDTGFTSCLHLQAVGGGPDRMEVTANETYSLGVYLRAGQAGYQGLARLRFYDASGNLVGSTDSNVVPTPVGEQVRATVTATAPANAVTMERTAFIYVVSGLAANGDHGWADDAMLVVGNAIPAQFDGDTPDDGTYTYSWTGPAHASTSTRTMVVESGPVEGGLATPLIGLSPEGRVYAAVRVTLESSLTDSLWLQIVDGTTSEVLAERAITGRRGETIEEFLPYEIPSANKAVRARLIQRGASNDAWRVDSLALFEDSILWEFSVNGGGDWYSANHVRNNDNGVLTFPDVGNQLRYRVRTHRPDQWVSAVKIRPWYVGTQNVRPTGTHRGPNLSVHDQDVPIHEDPMFTTWHKPVPFWWFAASRRFPLLPVSGLPNTNEFSRFYGRPVEEDISGVSDGVTHQVLQRRSAAERLDFFAPVSDGAVRKITAFRSGSDIAEVADEATGYPSIGISKPVFNVLVKPVFSERKSQ